VNPLLLVLTVIQNPETRLQIKKPFVSAGHRVIEANGFPQAQLLLSNRLDPDVLIVESPAQNSFENAQFREFLRVAPVDRTWLVVASNDQTARQEAIALGVRRFLTMPIAADDLETVLDDLNRPDAQEESVNEPAGAASADADGSREASFVPYIEELGGENFFLAASPKMLEIHRQVKLLADADVNVLILGESGTGKEVIAHLIHKYSQRAGRRFLKVNCAALPADLLESELFGHKQGAFTGAIKDRPGKFEQVNGGTLLLDEIGEMGVQMQAKLLHVLQDGQFTRLGGQESTTVDVRVLAATNIQMDSALLEKTFREDLYYRLSVFTLNIPPLRERREEIPYLIDETIRRAPTGMKNGGNRRFPSPLLDAVLLYDWPGNLRELHNFVMRAIIIRDPEAALRELETKIALAKGNSYLAPGGEFSHRSGMKSIVRDMKERTEAKMIQDALEHSGWNRRHAARSLNISYRALLYKIQQHRLTPRGAGAYQGTAAR
jgi:two-component system, NtrC family, response regulator AtoC